MDYSLEGRLLDIDAVAERAGFSQFSLFGGGHGSLSAAVYAATRPQIVTRLVLASPYARGDDLYRDSPRMRFVAGLEAVTVADQWEYTSAAIASRAIGNDPALRDILADVSRASMGPLELLAFRDAIRKIDITSLLPQIAAATLVIHMDTDFTPIRYSREFASAIPRSQLLTVSEGSLGLAPTPEVLDAIIGFVAADASPTRTQTAQPPGPVASGTAIILFADIADSTALTEDLGDAAFRDKARELDEALRHAIASNGGAAIDGKLLGDGVLATFGAAREAIACASACHSAATNVDLAIHVGIHAGDVIREDDNVYGGAVNIASRVANEAAAGETLVSSTVRDLARTSAGVSFEDRGERELKGVGEPVRVFAVREN
jgi:class 3 adenylate cyclase